MSTCLRINGSTFYPTHNYETNLSRGDIIYTLIADALCTPQTVDDVRDILSDIRDMVDEAVKLGKQDLLEELRHDDGFEVGTDCDGYVFDTNNDPNLVQKGANNDQLPEVPGVRPEPCRCSGAGCDAIGVSVDDEKDNDAGKRIFAEGDRHSQGLGHSAGSDNGLPDNPYTGLYSRTS